LVRGYWPRIFHSRDICSDCLADRLKKGTAIFAKVARIVTRWYGSRTNKEVVPQMIEDTIHAWKSGIFDGTNVFQAADASGAVFLKGKPLDAEPPLVVTEQATKEKTGEATDAKTAEKADIRIDMSRIGGQK
jgi:hypothetical protein